MPKVWIDTDFGSDSDDAIALLLALASPELDVQGISVVGRQSFVRALMVQALLDAAGRSDIPVYPGWDAPAVPPAALNANTPLTTGTTRAPGLLQQWAAYQFNWFGNAAWYAAANNPVEGVGVWAPPPDSTAAGAALANAYGSPSDVALLAIGPMTNIYQALARAASASGTMAANVPAIYTMGLHFHPTPFNNSFVSAAVDYNLAADTVSALAVFDAFAPLGSSSPVMNFVTADLTLQTWLTTGQLAQLATAGATYPVLAMLAQMIGAWSAKQAQLFGYTIGTGSGQVDNAGFLHDPLTIASSFGAIDPTTNPAVRPVPAAKRRAGARHHQPRPRNQPSPTRSKGNPPSLLQRAREPFRSPWQYHLRRFRGPAPPQSAHAVADHRPAQHSSLVAAELHLKRPDAAARPVTGLLGRWVTVSGASPQPRNLAT
jgi:purine nucleosidase